MKKLIYLFVVGFIGLNAYGQVDRSKPPKPQPNPKININIPEVKTTANGMKVIVVENHKLPKVSFQLFVDYPIMPEDDKAGLSDIFGELLGSGTESFSKDEFDAKVDYMGADIFTNSRGFFASSLKKHTPELLGLLSEVVMKPAFPKDEFDRIVNQSLSALESSKSDPNTMASNVSSVVKYGKDHPYGEIVTKKSLKNLELADVKEFYEKYFIPNNAYLVIVGDVTKEEANAYVEKYFSGWEKGETSEQQSFDTPEYEGNNVYFVNKPGAVQSVISINHTIDMKPGHEDAIKLRLMNQILGGGSFSAHLMRNLREDKAYTYGSYSRASSDPLVGSFSAGGSFRNEVTDSAVVEIMKEINWMTENLVPDEELALVKSSITGSFARSLEQPRTVAQFALNTARYNLPKDYYTSYLTRLEAITKEEIRDIAKKYLQPENLNIVIVGNEDVAEKQDKFDTNDGMEFRDAMGNEAMQLEPVPEGVTAQSIFKNYAFKRLSVEDKAAYEKALKKLGFIQTTYKTHIEEAASDMFVTSYKGKPNMSASIIKVSGAQSMVVQKEWFNGEEGGTFIIMQGKTKYEGEDLEDKKQPYFPFKQMYYDDQEDLNVELLGIEEIDDRSYYKIRIQEEGKEEFGFEYYDTETGWLVIEESFQKDDEGNMVSVKVMFDQYKELKKGFMIPNEMTLVNPGQPAMTMTLDNASIGKKPKSKAFEGEF